MSDPQVKLAVLFGPTAQQREKEEATTESTPEPGNVRIDPLREYRGDDGHIVRSKAELVICNWLYHHHVVHAYERRLPIPEDVLCDFLVEEKSAAQCYIEYWGLDAPSYHARRHEKLRLYRKYNLNLVELEEADLTRLDDVLPPKLLRFGIRTS